MMGEWVLVRSIDAFDSIKPINHTRTNPPHSRAQASMAEVCGADPTHGLLPLVSQTQGAAALELETLGSLCWARPPQARCVFFCAVLYCVVCRVVIG